MATLKLKKKAPADATEPRARKRPPVRRATPRPQQTLAQAQAERVAREEAFRRDAPPQRRSGPGGRPPTDRPPRDRQEGRDGRDARPDRPPRRDGDPSRPPLARRDGPPGDRRPPGAAADARPPRDARNLRGPADPRDERSQRDPRDPRDQRRPAPPRPMRGAMQPMERDPRPPRKPLAPARATEPGKGPTTPRQRAAAAASAVEVRTGAAAEGERLSKRMTALGLASRREADEWIEAGWVRVDGRMAVLGQRVGPDVKIDIDPAASRQQMQRMTVLLNKPVGYVSGQAEDGHEPAVVLVRPDNRWSGDTSGIPFHPGHLRSLVPAGRLDIDSIGLLVLTQDGRIAKQLIGDDNRVEKEYLVRVAYQGEGRLPDDALALLQHGLSLDDEPLKPAKVSWQNEDQLRFVLREGKKRQIRRMCEAVGLAVLSLKRVRIGSVALGQLPVGQWRYLRRDERFA